MKHHIIRTIALMMVVLMLISAVPSSVLPVLALGETDASASTSIFDNVTLGKDTVTNTESYNASTTVSNGTDSYRVVDSSYSPYEPYSTTDEAHPFLQGGSAWIDLSKIYYGAPATQNYPITKWSANTSVYNTTGTGETYETGIMAGEEIYAFEDLNLINEFTWAEQEDEIYDGEIQNGVVTSENNPSKQDGSAAEKATYKNTVTSKSDTEARVYNRYDAMQGKWGITLDKNVSSVTWTASYVPKYYGDKALNTSFLYLTDTPYLYYSTEALDSTQMAISLLIGTPVQDENVIKGTDDKSQTAYKSTTSTTNEYVYRWYTITDNAVRPGIDDPDTTEDESNLDASMVPNVHVSSIVMSDNSADPNNDIDVTLAYIAEGWNATGWVGDKDGLNVNWQENGTTIAADSTRLQPITYAEKTDGVDPETLYVSGSVTGCIDFTQILPLLMAVGTSDSGNGREGVKYRIAQIRVDTKTEAGAEDSAARINYLYFGPAMSAVLTPQSTVGNTVNGGNWLYAQHPTNIGDANSINGGVIPIGTSYASSGNEASYTNGWNNGAAVSVTNTPNEMQKLTIDTRGNGDGRFIVYTDSSLVYGSNSDKLYVAKSIYKGNASESKVWQYTTGTGDEVKTVNLEATAGANNAWYVTVNIPIRKWINVLGNARNLTFTLNVENAGDYPNAVKPGISIWGNDDGAVGIGHGDNGSRYNGEGLIANYGLTGSYYEKDNFDYKMSYIDSTIGASTVYNEQEVVTLRYHHLTDSNDLRTASGDFYEWVDADGQYYYQAKASDNYGVNEGTYYTIQQLEDTWGRLKYMIPGNGNHVYFYDADTREILDGDCKTVTGHITLSMLVPMYKLTAVSAPAGLTAVSASATTSADLLRSPYLLDDGQIVMGADDDTGVTEYMKGYVFVTSIHVVVPVGSIVTLENIQCSGNAAGLNSYSVEGNVVSAYDGGTGVQPNTKLGTVTDKAAAYGPYFKASNYTIYDLLDTEWISTSDGIAQSISVYNSRGPVEYTHASNCGLSDTHAVYSYPFGESTGNSSFSDKTDASGSFNSTYLGKLEKSDPIQVYGTVLFSDGTYKNTLATEETWGLIVYNNQPAWVKLSYYSSSGWHYNYTASQTANLLFTQTYHDPTSVTMSTLVSSLLPDLTDKWVYTSFTDTPTENYTITVDDVWNSALGIPAITSTADKTVAKVAHYVKAKTGTDLEFGFTGRTDNDWRALSMSRFFSNSNKIKLTIDTNGNEKSYPVLYYDFDKLTASGYVTIGLSLQVGTTNYLYYLNSQDTLVKAPLSYGATALSHTSAECGYFSLEGIMKELGWTLEGDTTIYVTGIHLMYSTESASSASETIRRLEIWQDKTTYLDRIVREDGTLNTGGTDATYKTKIADGFNIINDAFFATHDEADDNSLVKQNSNKGWSAWLEVDSDSDGKYDDEAYRYYPNKIMSKNGSDFSTNHTLFTTLSSPGVDGVYEYRTSLGHLRVWVPGANTDKTYANDYSEYVYTSPGQAKIAFNSDRAFNTSNYKYLYYSYSMRDVGTGIGAEDNISTVYTSATATEQKRSGIMLTVRETSSETGYVLNNSDQWTYTTLNNSQNYYYTTVNAAVNLSTLSDIGSVRQIALYLQNWQPSTAEFYINYIYLSNVAPDEAMLSLMNKEQTQYYYLMDDTGDRYSARFPTLDNPTGQVTGLNTDSDRVNPIKVTRGALLSEGTYLNGEPLSGYGSGTAVDGVTEGFYGKTYDDNNALEHIWFYTGQDENKLDDILDFYDYEDRGRLIADSDGKTSTIDKDGQPNKYDMLWSYGRWFTGGESVMNIMYIGDPDLDQSSTGAYTANAVSGALASRYATENYVLLRAGITPKTYTTYFDADGGEFLYDSSPDYITNLQQVTENNYYITSSVVFSYFNQPLTASVMKGNTGTDYSEFLVKPGYTFAGWELYTDYGTPVEDAETLKKYTKKTTAGADYFKAVWTPIQKDNVTATFKYPGGTVKTETVGNEVTDLVTKKTSRFVLSFPTTNRYWYQGKTVTIYGWQDTVTKKVFSPSDKVYLLKDATFEAVTDSSLINTFTVTLKAAELYVWTTAGNQLPLDEKFGVTCSPDPETGANVYSKVPENYRLIAKPTGDTENIVWMKVRENGDQLDCLVNNTTTILSSQTDYEFTAHENISLCYDTLPTLDFYSDQNNLYVTISHDLNENIGGADTDEQAVYFTAQYDVVDSAKIEILAAGTMITKTDYYDAYTNHNASFRLNETVFAQGSNETDDAYKTRIGTVIANRTWSTLDTKGIKQAVAESTSKNREFTTYIAHTKDTAIRYYARAYVIYRDRGSGAVKVAYSDVAAYGTGYPVTTINE